MGQTCEPFQRPEATQGVAIVGMNPQRAAQVRGGSLEVAALQLDVPQHRQRERDRRRVSQRATDRVVLAQQPLGRIEIALVQRQHTVPEQPERQEHAARRMRARQAGGLDEESLRCRRVGRRDSKEHQRVRQVPRVVLVAQQGHGPRCVRCNLIDRADQSRCHGCGDVGLPRVERRHRVRVRKRRLQTLPALAEMPACVPVPMQGGAEPQRRSVVPGLVCPVTRGSKIPLFGDEPRGQLAFARAAKRLPLTRGDQLSEELRVSPAQIRHFVRGGEPVVPVLAQRLQQAIARFAPHRLHHDERLVHEGRQDVEDAVVGTDRLDGIEREGPGEHGQPPKQRGLGRVEQRVAPVDGFAQRPVPRHGRSAGGDEQLEGVVEPSRDLLGREHAHSRRRQLDRQRNAVEPPTDLRDRGGVRVIERERGKDPARALEKQPARLRAQD